MIFGQRKESFRKIAHGIADKNFPQVYPSLLSNSWASVLRSPKMGKNLHVGPKALA